jgi:hypothetical protein
MGEENGRNRMLIRRNAMDLYSEFRKMVKPMVIEDEIGEKPENLESRRVADENDEVEEEQSELAFAR